MKKLLTLDISRSRHLGIGQIYKLEKKCRRELTLSERIFLVHLGSTQVLLEIIFHSKIEFEVVKQEEKARKLRRDVAMLLAKSRKVLVLASSCIYKDKLPAGILIDLRQRKTGLGAILANHKVITSRQITSIGCDKRTSSIFRTYNIHCRGNVLAEIREMLNSDQ